MNVISASYGNDSVAMIQWAHERSLPDVTVAYCDTGWAAPYWPQRVSRGESLACQNSGLVMAVNGKAKTLKSRPALQRVTYLTPSPNRYRWRSIGSTNGCEGKRGACPILWRISMILPQRIYAALHAPATIAELSERGGIRGYRMILPRLRAFIGRRRYSFLWPVSLAIVVCGGVWAIVRALT